MVQPDDKNRLQSVNRKPNQPAYRKLRGFAFDPSFSFTLGRRQSNEVTYKVKWEETCPGPVGEYVEIIDYDPTKQCYYEAIDLDQKYVLSDHGLSPSEGDPKFHQQQVYAVVMSVIAQFERALGRKIIWTRLVKKDQDASPELVFVPRIRIYPHALRQQNAYYSPDKVALLFGYFQASNHWAGNNIPGTAIFTCLSPDIIAHETTHAILDSMFPYFKKPTNPDMLAFHEGFSDIIALLQRFTFKSVVEEQIRLGKGNLLSSENLLGDLAIQFGQAISDHQKALRSYLVTKDKDGKFQVVTPDPAKYYRTKDPHGRGAILVAAVFDAFVRLHKHRVADLIRLATGGTGVLPDHEIHPDLVRRLADEACEIANKLMLICIRALDYCPPIDLTFGDYLRSLITADVEHNPEDEDGLRFALLESFRSWGIIPKKTNTYAVESLMWKGPEEFFESKTQVEKLKQAIQYIFDPEFNQKNPEFTFAANRDLQRVMTAMDKILRENRREEIFEESKTLCAIMHDNFEGEMGHYMSGFEKMLGMDFGQIQYEFRDEETREKLKLSPPQRKTFQVHTCRPVMRQNYMSGNSTKLLIITFLQKVYVPLEGTSYAGYLDEDQYTMRGGATLIIDLATYEIKYSIVKNIGSSSRLKTQLEFATDHPTDENESALLMQSKEPFAALHIH